LRASRAILALLDKDADEEMRTDGALLIAFFLSDVALIRSVFFKLEGE
jgi:hypothetical protein